MKPRRPDVLYSYTTDNLSDKAKWLKKFTDQGLWVVPLGDDEYQIVEPREWFCPCGRWVENSPQCMHGEELSPQGERRLAFFNVLMWDVANVEQFEHECEADRSGRR